MSDISKSLFTLYSKEDAPVNTPLFALDENFNKTYGGAVYYKRQDSKLFGLTSWCIDSMKKGSEIVQSNCFKPAYLCHGFHQPITLKE